MNSDRRLDSAMTTVAVIGLGYVGLPLALAFARRYRTVGYDRDAAKIERCRRGRGPVGRLVPGQAPAERLDLTTNPDALRGADFLVIAVPTPVDAARRPDLSALEDAVRTVGEKMKKGCTVVVESTVYPGVTEEVCVPILEKASGMRWRRDFHVVYSPERINPGDAEHSLERVVKLVSADSAETLESAARLYESIIDAGVYRVSSIKVAEAAKVIENTQRDLNIALVNELAMIFHRLGIDTMEVLEAASTKWNFLPFRPGLVGGHCIGVDPYYLTYKAQMLGHYPQVILAGREINDRMGKYVAEQTVKQMIKAGQPIKGARVNVLGLTFKEDCPDIRNSLVADLIAELEAFGLDVSVHDPHADPVEAKETYGLDLVAWEALPVADATVFAVAHSELVDRGALAMIETIKPGGCFIDVKSVFERDEFERRGIGVWRL